MTNKALSIFNQLRPVTVGFDNVFDHFERMFEDDFTTITAPSFPYYNIVKKSQNNYDIEVALAGYSKDDIEVNLENGVLSIKSKKEDKSEEKEDGEVIHKGIAKRYFSKAFTIADDVEVKGAELKDGLLKVSLERIVPESKKPRTIDIK
jgi:molecular chaperone IbpA